MKYIRSILIFLQISLVLAELASGPIKHLNRLIENVNKVKRIESVLVFQRHENKNCSVQDWNPPGSPIIRLSELAQIGIRQNFNSKVMALVCIHDDKDLILLDSVGVAYENMRYQRILLWSRKKPTKEFFEEIINYVRKLKFIKLIVLEVDDKGVISAFGLKTNIDYHFVRIEDVLNTQDIYADSVDFNGMTALVKEPVKSDLLYSTPNGNYSLFRMEDLEVIEFAKKYNLTLKMLYENDTNIENFDIELRLKLTSKRKLAGQLGYVNPLSSTSLIVIVPCGNSLSLKDIFQQLDIKTWFLYILIVYAILILMENLILLVTCKITAQPYHLGRSNLLVNLCAFQALLGMPFPVSRRLNLSLRQLFLAMSIFGMVFSNFFSCKLSALLTKHSHKPGITNLEELRESGLMVIVDPDVHSFLQNDLDNDLIQRYFPLTKTMRNRERLVSILSFNITNAYIIYKENWSDLEKYQLSMGRKAYCTTKDLVVVDNLPRAYVLQKDSIYHYTLSRFVTWIQEAGITKEWSKQSGLVIKKLLNLTYASVFRSKDIPLSLADLQWLGYVLGLGYGLAILAFIIEIFYYRRRHTMRETYPEFTV